MVKNKIHPLFIHRDNLTEFVKALLISAFFIASVLPASAATSLSCNISKPGTPARIRYIHDGDTIVLTDNRHVRLIGIDTPELARDNRPADAFALEARDYARELIQQTGMDIRLIYGAETRDHYGRTLAHVILADNSLLQAHLLKQGLAVAYTTPPNSALSDCYQQLESDARTQKRQLWAYPKYLPVMSTALTEKHRGFRLVTGKVVRIGQSKKAIWINLEGAFAARIAKSQLKYFSHIKLKDWVGKNIEVHGWVKHYDNRWHINVRHPSAITVID